MIHTPTKSCPRGGGGGGGGGGGEKEGKNERCSGQRAERRGVVDVWESNGPVANLGPYYIA